MRVPDCMFKHQSRTYQKRHRYLIWLRRQNNIHSKSLLSLAKGKGRTSRPAGQKDFSRRQSGGVQALPL